MTGRSWRYALTIMPHMIAGVGGPAEECLVQHVDAAPAREGARVQRPVGEHDELDDGHGPDADGLQAADEVLPDPVVADVISSEKYKRLYGELPLHRAVLDVFCRMAALGGRLMGDNMTNTTHMSERQMRSLADEAREFVLERVDLLFGPAHTTKAHRLANHLLAALMHNGNLWEGDTSENEALHGPCKKMYMRTNKRGPSMVLQMMRAAEAQTEVLRELCELKDEDNTGLLDLFDGDPYDEDVPTAPVQVLVRSHRSRRVTIADMMRTSGMTQVGELLGKPVECNVVLSSSFSFFCTFEWGAPAVMQTAHASESYMGKPRYDFIWYTNGDGERELGYIRLVVRMLAGAVDDFVVVCRLHEVPSIPHCSLTRSGCKRLAWCFSSADDEWPLLARVPLSHVLRIEHVVPDFQDLGDRRGLRAVTSNIQDTAAERHVQRFFTNCFFPLTSRAMNPSS